MNKIPVYKRLGIIVLIVLIFIALPSCHQESLIIDSLETVCFDTQIIPLLQTSCGISGCHDRTQEGFLVADYQSVMQLVIPGDPRASELYKVITDINNGDMMPPGLPLTREQRTLIHVWIAQGALETACQDSDGGPVDPPPGKADSVCFVQDILPLFISSCTMSGCHDGLSQEEDEDELLFALNSYVAIMDKVEPSDPSESDVYEAVNESGDDLMPPPPNLPLNAAQKEMMRKWIAEGALNSDCPDVICDTAGIIAFTTQVKSTIDKYCRSCHNATVTNGGVNLDGYEQVKGKAETLRNGIPLLIGALRQLSGFRPMPPVAKLDDCSIRKIELWISQGKLNN